MHLLLIRHGETEHNAERLGKALAETRGLRFTHIFASTLQRARLTADSVQKHQARSLANDDSGSLHKVPQVVQSGLIIEHDFGSFELTTKWSALADGDPDTPGFRPRETADAMKRRADRFIEDCLLPLVVSEGKSQAEEAVVAVLSHGMFLKQLWKSIWLRFRPGSVSFAPTDGSIPPPSSSSLGEIGRWSNTAYLECTIRRPRPSPGALVAKGERDFVLAINRSDHLHDLKRDGVGNSPYDVKQQSIKAFFSQQTQDL
ncbi:hypothetical protein DV738_g3048, partial [Chaetothyriales sp. CBS 135597]